MISDIEMSKVETPNSRGRCLILLLALTFLLTPFARESALAQLDQRYHTYEEMLFELDSLAAAYPAIMRVDSIGHSTQDNLGIWAVKISDNVEVDEDEPAVLFNGVHHAEEVLGLEICLSMIGELVSRYGRNMAITGWVNSIEIWFVPLLNPEGHRVVTGGLDVTYRKNKRDNNGNGLFDFIPEIGGDIDGVDPNRNYDFNWELGDTDWSSDYYRGTAPFSEAENRAIRDLAIEQRFVFAILYHSARTGTKEVVYYPWCWEEKRPPDFSIIENTAQEVAALITRDDGTAAYAPWCSSQRAPFARDWFYVRTGTIPMLIEVGSAIHPPGHLVDDICTRNKEGAYYLLDRVLQGGITGTVTDSLTGMPLEAEVAILEASGAILSRRLCDALYGRFRRILLPGLYTMMVSKAGYRTEQFSDIPVNPSSPTVIDVALAPLALHRFSGTVTDIHSGHPLGATLIVNGPQTDTIFSHQLTGEFEAALCEEDYILNVLVDEYVPLRKALHLSGDTTMAMALYPADIIFFDDFETGIPRWESGGTFNTWDITASLCHSQSHSLTDSPGGFYLDGSDSWSAPSLGLALSQYQTAGVVFWHQYNLEPDYDSAFVEWSTDNGASWHGLGEPFSASSGGWVCEVRSLSKWCGAADTLRIRFRLLADGSVDADGWYIDDVLVLAGGAGVSVEDGRGFQYHQGFHLGQNYPNPFNPATTIHYILPVQSGEFRVKGGEGTLHSAPFTPHVTLKIFNVLGQEVRTLTDEVQEPGYYTAIWDGRDNSGREVSSGVYLYRVTAGSFAEGRRMVLLR